MVLVLLVKMVLGPVVVKVVNGLMMVNSLLLVYYLMVILVVK